MKRIIGILLFTFAAVISANAQRLDQKYETGLGIKVWGYAEAGISLKHFIKQDHALEGIGYFWYNGVRFTGLYEFHFPIAGAPGLLWYIGPGAHLGIYNSQYRNQFGDAGTGGAFVGVDGVIGLDYKFNGAPINISIDWQPSIEFGTTRAFQGGWGGIGIRYTF